MFDWEEDTTLTFLKAYERHPCLWNPYHKDYHNCLSKNVALNSIIRSLNIPQLTPTDCLHQINSIRQKYGDEQLRRIRNMQCHAPYKSPYSWYDVITRMLEKVIKDEDDYNACKVLRSPVSETSLGWDHRLKSEHGAKLKKRTQKLLPGSKFQRYPCASYFSQRECQREIKSVENLIGIRENSKSKYDDAKTGVSAVTANLKEDRKRANCVKSDNDTELLGFVECPSCGWEVDERNKLQSGVEKSFINTYGTAVIPPVKSDIQCIQKSRNDMGTLTDKSDTRSLSTQANPIRDDVNEGVQCVRESETTKDIDIRRTLVAALENCTLGTYAHLKVLILNTDQDLTLCTKEQAVMTSCFETTEAECSTKNCPGKKSARNADEESPILAERSTSCEELFQIHTICVSDKATAPKYELNVAEINTCQRSDIEVQCMILEASNEIEKVDDICNNESCAREIAKETNEDPILTYVMLHCLDKVLHLEDKYKIHVVASFLKEKLNLKTNNETKDTVSHLSAEETQDNNAIGTLTKMFLEVLKRAMDLDSKHIYFENANCKCIADSRLNGWPHEIFEKIESCLSKVLELDKLADTIQYQSNPDLSLRYEDENKSNECEDENLQTDLTPFADNKDYHDYQDDTTFVESIVDDNVPKENKQVYVRIDSRDVGSLVDGTLSIILRCDKGTQIVPTPLTDSSVITVPDVPHAKISMGTQKRDPILVRVIRCNNEQEIAKSDKQVSTPDTNINAPNERRNSNGVDMSHMRHNGNTCQINCKAPFDWTNVQIDHSHNTSKIPINLHKHVRRKDVVETMQTRPRNCSGVCQG